MRFNQVASVIVLLVVQQIIAGDLYARSFPYGSAIDSVVFKSNGDSDLKGYARKQDQDQAKYISDVEDFTKLYNKDNLSQGHDVIHVQTGKSDSSDRHVVGQDKESDKSHNRKHVKSGFHNTYNKDESGSNSSYYEDSDDRGGNSSYDKRHGTKNDDYDRKYLEGVRDGGVKDRGDDRVSRYSSSGGNRREQSSERDNGNRQGESNSYDRYVGHERAPGYYQSDRYGVLDRAYDNDRDRRPYHRRQDIDVKPLYNMPMDYYTNSNYAHRSSTGNDYLPPLHQPSYSRYSATPQDDFLRQRIRIYDDPREFSTSAETERRDSSSSDGRIRPNSSRRQELASSSYSSSAEDTSRIYHAPRLEYRPSPLRLRDYRTTAPLSLPPLPPLYDEQRDSLRRYRDY